MIEIDNIGEITKTDDIGEIDDYELGYKYRFPTIDFKFQNTGNATAFLWQFAIRVLHAETDPTPELRFEAGVKDRALEVMMTNYGWGPAHNCQVEIAEDTLNLIFAKPMLQYRGSIESGESKRILQLTADTAIPGWLETVSKRFETLCIDPEDYSLEGGKDQYELLDEDEDPDGKLVQAILLRLGAKWHCRDEKGNKHSGTTSLKTDEGSEIILTPNGFLQVFSGGGGGGGGMKSYVTYITLIDPLKGAYEQTYPISRKIPPGEVERFHIMIGSKKSCHLRIQFRFFVDKKKIVESEDFDINIWNAKNSRWDNDYADGAKLSRKLTKAQSRSKGAGPSYGERIRVGNIQNQASDYPFTDRKKSIPVLHSIRG